MRFVVVRLVLLATLASIVALTGCGEGASVDSNEASTTQVSEALEKFEGFEGSVRIAGGTAHLDIMNEAARRIRGANPDISFEIEGGHTRLGIEGCAMGAVDIGNSGRRLTNEEKALYPDLVSFEFARDAVVLIVNPANPVTDLTSQQVRDIYAGRITDWAGVGGSAGPIHPYTYDAASGTCEVFCEHMLGDEQSAASVERVATMLDAADRVADDPQAIAYTGRAETDDREKVLSLDGVAPNEETIVSGAYALSRPLVMTTKGRPQGLVKAFVDYILSEEMAEAIRQDGYIPIR